MRFNGNPLWPIELVCLYTFLLEINYINVILYSLRLVNTIIFYVTIIKKYRSSASSSRVPYRFHDDLFHEYLHIPLEKILFKKLNNLNLMSYSFYFPTEWVRIEVQYKFVNFFLLLYKLTHRQGKGSVILRYRNLISF